MKKVEKVSLYDTTLRDGNQAIGIGFSLSDKLKIVEKLDDLGIHYIEGGWPNPTNPIDYEFYKEISKMKFKSKMTAFGSTKRAGTKAGLDPFLKMLVKANTPVATIFGKSWDLHVTEVLRCDLAENLDMIGDSIIYLKKKKDEVIYDAEHFFDGYINNKEYALKTLYTAQEAGADIITLCDTNGGLLPTDFIQIFRDVKEKISTPLGLHLHNDTGCAEANSFIGVDEGAILIQGTINGLGERCGNANLCTIIPGLQVKRKIELISKEQLASIKETSIYVNEIANLSHNVRLPYVGESAFSHKGGAHIDGVRKIRKSFEHISPETVGNKRHFVLSAQAGSSTIIGKLKNIKPNVDKKDPLVKKLLQTIKNMESEGYLFEAADGTFQLLVHKQLGDFTEPFKVKGFRVIEEKRDNGDVYSEATIKVQEGNKFVHTAADGDGPINALDNALRKALVKFFPPIKDVVLEDYKVRVLDEHLGTASKVRVLIESSDGKERWCTIGVSTNIIEASWIALIASLKYKLIKEEKNRN